MVHPDQQLAKKPHVAAHTRAGIGVARSSGEHSSKHTFSATIAATGYLRGLPLGHTAASIENSTLIGSSPPPSARSLAALSAVTPQIQLQQDQRNLKWTNGREQQK